jgi:Ran GTPase-activating protein (RanGAP) involved in mRNA processing and transport
LAAALPGSSLLTLDISGTDTMKQGRVTNVGAKALAVGLTPDCVLEALILSNNEIGDKGTKALAFATESGRCALKDLDLSFNRITDDGAKALARALESESCCLEEIYLEGNQITDIGADALTLSVKSNPCVKIIDVEDNDHVSDRAKQNLKSALNDLNRVGPCAIAKTVKFSEDVVAVIEV